MRPISRRRFIATTGSLSASVALWPSIIIPQKKKRLGVALVGLGYYSTDLLAPALQLTDHCYLAGIVTGSPEKISPWQEKYSIPDANVYNYQNMASMADNDAIDVIYIVLPTGLHARYSIMAANAGKHVWCEKPMARTEKECQSIIDACTKNKVKLTIGYRMQHEPNTQTIMKYALTKPYGDMNEVMAQAGYVDSRKDHWKMNKEMGGGAMYDMGVYPLNASRYATQREPLAVTARHETTRPEIFHEVDETTYFNLEFPDGIIAKGVTSLGKNMNSLRVECSDGWYTLEPFQSYTGVKGVTSDGKLLDKKIDNQQARQMDDDALAIIHNTPVIVPGEEGLQDIRIVEAIYRAAATGQRVTI
jgi:glucose-fructose oxidoreductase